MTEENKELLTQEEQTIFTNAFKRANVNLQLMIVDGLKTLSQHDLEKVKGDFVVEVCAELIACMSHHIGKSTHNSFTCDQVLEQIHGFAEEKLDQMKREHKSEQAAFVTVH